MKTLIPSILAAALASCSGTEVRSDYDPTTDFARYTSYAWLTHPSLETDPALPEVSELLEERIQRAVDEGLLAKGIDKEPEEDASFLVTYHLSFEEKLQFNDPYYSFDTVETYEEGTLLLDFVDAATRRLVWRGIGQTRVTPSSTPQDRQERVKAVVDAVLAQYPPK